MIMLADAAAADYNDDDYDGDMYPILETFIFILLIISIDSV